MTPSRSYPGEFEQMVLLAVMRLDEEAYAISVLEELEARADRSVSRGALYRTLDRLEGKGMLEWAVDEEAVPERGGRPRRRFRVTPEGVRAVREAREAFDCLWEGLEPEAGVP